MHRLLALTLAIGSLPAPLRAAAVVAPAVRISGPALGGVIPTLQLPSLTAPLSSPTPVFTLSPSLGLAPSLTGTPALHLPQAAIAGPSAEALKTPAPVLQAVSPARASALGAAAAGASMLPAARKGVSAAATTRPSFSTEPEGARRHRTPSPPQEAKRPDGPRTPSAARTAALCTSGPGRAPTRPRRPPSTRAGWPSPRATNPSSRPKRGPRPTSTSSGCAGTPPPPGLRRPGSTTPTRWTWHG